MVEYTSVWRVKTTRGERSKVLKHYYKKHVAYDQVPFYCTICKFITTSQKELEDHVNPKTYPAHAAIVNAMRQAGESVNEKESLLQNMCHYIVSETDVKRLSKTEKMRLSLLRESAIKT